MHGGEVFGDGCAEVAAGAADFGEEGEGAAVHAQDAVFFVGHTQELVQRTLFFVAGVVPRAGGIKQVVLVRAALIVEDIAYLRMPTVLTTKYASGKLTGG